LTNQRFDAIDQRFDAMDKRIDRLTEEVSELRRLTVSISERVSRNEGQIDVIREQIQAADTPSP
jgi:predicted  nucleic acid-binding Zn-ribbon protein